MDSLPLISILVLLFSFLLVSETIRLKKELRKLTRLTILMQKDIDKLKAISDEK
tara:strand:+ start:1052 stop:1213 length:162 start_codon:yes stop_codon:yes gene_type:complete